MHTEAEALWFIFHDKTLLLKTGMQGIGALPRGASMPFAGEKAGATIHSLGEFTGRGASSPCYAVNLASMPKIDANQYEFTNLRATYDILGEPLYTLAGKGAEMIHWDSFSQYCPVCGTKTALSTPLSKKCPACGNEIFPSISVATIVLVRKGDAALLIRSRNNPRNTHGLVAGFLEPGETLEECVTREVMEETGLEITNVTYFASQPWPYPCGLMVGYTAEYKSGEIVVQEEELSSAAFFTRDNPPNLPHKLSIARRLIDLWLEDA
ncbi:MAG: NADH pyrophosphatase [Desulfovibrio sp.]